jgi:hypothetical protein
MSLRCIACFEDSRPCASCLAVAASVRDLRAIRVTAWELATGRLRYSAPVVEAIDPGTRRDYVPPFAAETRRAAR